MSLSDTINLLLAIASFLIAIISILVAIFTLKQNSKMIENATRPYLVLYGGIINASSPQYVLVLKNFGNSSAILKELKFSNSISYYLFDSDLSRLPFNNLVGSNLSPRQTIRCALSYPKIEDKSKIKPITIHIAYTANRKIYEDTIQLNPIAELSNPSSRKLDSRDSGKTVAFTLQDICEKLL